VTVKKLKKSFSSKKWNRRYPHTFSIDNSDYNYNEFFCSTVVKYLKMTPQCLIFYGVVFKHFTTVDQRIF